MPCHCQRWARTAQYFDCYGEKGHELAYFIGNENIPDWIRSSLVLKMEETAEVRSLSQPNGLSWNLTVNAYSLTPQKQIAGFPFHIDVASNGAITAIFTFLSSATLEIRKLSAMKHIEQYRLTPSSMLLLSGESRWDCEHRVLPDPVEDGAGTDNPANSIRRLSLVLGCHPKQKK